MISQDIVPDDLHTSVQQTHEPWRRCCRREAQRAADMEERERWNIGSDETTPFRHRWEHVQHVVSLALWLAEETGADHEIVEAAAWLHDVRKMEPDHGLRGAESALQILRHTNFPPNKIDAVADAICQHVGMTRADLSPLQPLEAAVLWDADKLSKIGVQALLAAMSSQYSQGMPLAERRQRNLEFIENVLSQTVKSMNTDPARTLAEERYRQNLDVMAAWHRDENVAKR